MYGNIMEVGEIVKFKLVEDTHKQSGSYARLWRQFQEVQDLLGSKIGEFDLHHISNSRSSQDGSDTNYIILPKQLHALFTRDARESRNLVQQLRSIDPNNFHTVAIRFHVYAPDPHTLEDLVGQLRELNKENKLLRRREARQAKKAGKTLQDIHAAQDYKKLYIKRAQQDEQE